MDRILVVDDEALIRDLLKETVIRCGIEVETASSGENAIEKLKETEVQMMFVDMRMNKMSGMDVLSHVRERYPHIIFVLMTAYGSIETAVDAMKMGAFDFIIKPFTPDQTEVLIEKAKNWLQLNERQSYFKNEAAKPRAKSSRIIGQSEAIESCTRLIEKVAPTRANVLVTGESGTGKELIAAQIHRLSNVDGSMPYIRMNCAAVPEALLESELFGHEKGSFTGAQERRIGRFELADGGTLLLDEIGEIPLGMQAKLLRVLQESEFERVGGNKTIKVDVRVIATTNKDLKKEVNNGNFREDLYCRLNVFPIELPPLRERGKDMSLIAKSFLKRQAKVLGKSMEFSRDAIGRILDYSWPGNIRELENVIERVTILEDGPVIDIAALPVEIQNPSLVSVPISENCMLEEITFNIRELERRTVLGALEKTKGNRARAADLLGFSVRTLRNKINEYRATGLLEGDPWVES
ncbi:MAG: sigma-54-dependent Fis family transcriptional regulator [Lentisphaeria bacterium]|nr:sigma-54-dependent Fis family transcriptional regulator [Lentisphaeria bacterium]